MGNRLLDTHKRCVVVKTKVIEYGAVMLDIFAVIIVHVLVGVLSHLHSASLSQCIVKSLETASVLSNLH